MCARPASLSSSRGANPLRGWQVDRNAIRTAGRELQRPECVLAQSDGTLWSADARGGIVRIGADGSQRLISQRAREAASTTPKSPEDLILRGTLPNGIALDRDGSFLIANFGTNAIERMNPDGSTQTLYTEI